jgi:hypothetical protein
MKAGRFASLALIFGFLSVICTAQEGPRPESGTGVLVPGTGIQSFHINFPLVELDLMKPGVAWSQAGKIVRMNSLNLMYSVNSSGAAFRVSDRDLVELEPKGYCLKIFDRKGGYVRVLKNSSRSEFWINISHLDYIRYKPMNWMEYFLSHPQVYLCQVDMGLNLRTQPGPEGSRVLLVKGNHYGIILSGKTDGYWAEAKVQRFSTEPYRQIDKNPKAQEEWTGWIKIVDDAGYPNIWFPSGK